MTTPVFSNPPGSPQPVGQYSNVSMAPAGSRLVYVAGQLPVDHEGMVVAPGEFAQQADLVFDTLAATLGGSGSSLSAVTLLRAFLVSDDHWVPFRDARRRAFERHGVVEPPPATTVVVAGLYGGSLIELDATAVC